MRIHRTAFIPMALLAFGAFGCGGEEAPPPKAPEPTLATPEPAPAPALKDIVDTAAAAGKFNTLATALDKAGLTETLKGPGPYTVFAPTDEAFAKVPKKTLDELGKDTEKLKNVLTYHVVAGKVMAADVSKLTTAKTVQGSDVKVKADAKGVPLDGKVKVVEADVDTGNGVIHVIDGVLMPPPAPKGAKPAAKAPPAGTGAGPGAGDHHGGGGGKGQGGGKHDKK